MDKAVDTAPSPLEAHKRNLLGALLRLATIKRQTVDVAVVRDTVDAVPGVDAAGNIKAVCTQLAIQSPVFKKSPQQLVAPFLAILPGPDVAVVAGQVDGVHWTLGRYASDGAFTETTIDAFEPGTSFVGIEYQSNIPLRRSHTFKLIVGELLSQRRPIFEVALAGIFMMFLAVSVSLFSIQVYDRVIPSSAQATLLVLASGAFLALIFELLLKFARSGVVEKLTDSVDINLARSVMARFLGVRFDKLPASVGSATQVLKGYETVRGFLVSFLTMCTVDMPVAIFLLGLVFLIGGQLALIPAAFFGVGLVLAVFFHRRLTVLAGLSQNAHSRKTGILVESVEAAETLKSNNARWRVLSQWVSTTNSARDIDNQLKHVSENAQYILLLFQQISYISLISVGALQVIQGNLTIGSVIGCSILSGRILTPISQIPSLMINWAHAKMALKSLESYWNLPQENEGETTSYSERLRGPIELTRVPSLRVNTGERVGLVGPVGSGKSSLIRLLLGLIGAEQGKVQIGHLSIATLDRVALARDIGYVSQEARLISGTIRDNLILGMPDPGEARIADACALTGVTDYIIGPSPKGLETAINESGAGLSGGQKQLIHLTRALLKQPSILLLDEPTASLDGGLEQRVIDALGQYCEKNPETILVVASHRPKVFGLVNRLIVVTNGEISMDDTRDAVLARIAPGTERPTV
ncbi:ATP-binding cassette domain-containing protein [Litorivicinus lipolyticus]|uniref:ATP-binding cassette domain-containing protein n=1 Tax=Litorivicinus lipolyticus TaxID=418701 RepID=A0A5Q2QAV8_9GAMM|nr:ATP-binding cassette domain-containing protein [Litorivicinus lipolyticus]QGG80184.1 ATP-binding cassette domain-containing protein [Litorivicinus lipolyticus]